MIRILGLFLIVANSSCESLKSTTPPPKTEFRGVWIATVANIDWPPPTWDSWENQKEAYLDILDFYGQLQFNAIVLQIRTAGDALYPTDLAPWSRFLTGSEGSPPNTTEDPLEWLIEQAHQQGFEFHAWLNPYRATVDTNTDILSEDHDFYRHSEWMIPYGNKNYYDPGRPEVRKHLVSVMNEVVENYNIDGLHFDDYFYPYRRENEVFNDSTSFEMYAMEDQALADWRRSNIDSLIRDVHSAVKERKPWVQFGISPFGVWKNRDQDQTGSDTRAGQTTYFDLYADPLLWAEKGWIDYLVPQIYWSLDFDAAAYSKLLPWWSGNIEGVNLYIGNAAYKVRNNSDQAWRKRKELPNQLKLTRSDSVAKGNVLFSANSLMKHKKLSRYLRKKVYKSQAIAPASPTPRIAQYVFPKISAVDPLPEKLILKFSADDPGKYRFAVVYANRKKQPISIDDPTQIRQKIFLDGNLNISINRELLKSSSQLGITFIDLYGSESQPVVLNLNQYDQKE